MASFAAVDRRPSRAALRELAATFAVATALFALHALYVRGDSERAARIGALGAAISLTPLVPGLGRFVYVAWMGLGVAIGRVMGPVVLTLVYFVVIVPLALFARALGRDRLQLARKRAGESYWRRVEKAARKSDYFRPF